MCELSFSHCVTAQYCEQVLMFEPFLHVKLWFSCLSKEKGVSEFLNCFISECICMQSLIADGTNVLSSLTVLTGA